MSKYLSHFLRTRSIRFQLIGCFSVVLLLVGSAAVFAFFQVGLQKDIIKNLFNQTTTADWIASANGVKSDLFSNLWAACAVYEKDKPGTAQGFLDEAKNSASVYEDFLGRYTDELNRAADDSRAKEGEILSKMKDTWQTMASQTSAVLTQMQEAKIEKSAIIETLNKLSDQALVINEQLSGSLTLLRGYGTLQYQHGELIQKIMIMIGIGITVTGLPLILLAFIGIGRLSSSLQNISHYFQLAAQTADFSHRIKADDSRELTRITTAFNALAESFAHKIALTDSLASGDFTSDLSSLSEQDKLGSALRRMSTQLSELIGNIYHTSNRVQDGAAEISDASAALSSGATQQAASLGQISSTIIEVSRQTKSTAQSAEQANTMASQAKEAAMTGSTQMAATVEAIRQITEASKKIVTIIKTIDDIAFQTNLLALNAAVEAARAGQAGLSFKVVAAEVRALANNSAKAARKTSELIDEANKQVEAGVKIAEQTSQSFQVIVDKVVNVATALSEIKSGSTQQAQGVQQITIALHQIEKVTEQNTATAEQTASASEVLTGEIATLGSLLSRFKIARRG